MPWPSCLDPINTHLRYQSPWWEASLIAGWLFGPQSIMTPQFGRHILQNPTFLADIHTRVDKASSHHPGTESVLCLDTPLLGWLTGRSFIIGHCRSYQLQDQNQAKLLLSTAGASILYQARSCTVALMSLPHFIHRTNLWDGLSIITEEVRLQGWNKFPRNGSKGCAITVEPTFYTCVLDWLT